MKNTELIAEAVRIIEGSLSESLTVAALAERIGFSQYYFIRLFQGVTGTTPKDYILSRKLTEAAARLRATERKVVDVAFELGFNDHETFSRAFKRQYGCSPKAYRAGAVTSPSADTPAWAPGPAARIVEPCNRRSSSSPSEPELRQVESLTVAGLCSMVQFGSEAAISDLWRDFAACRERLNTRCLPERCLQVAFWLDDKDAFFVMASVEVSTEAPVPFPFVARTIPAGDYLRFVHPGTFDTVGATYRHIYEDALPRTSYRLGESFNFEVYGEDAPCSVSIYIPVQTS